MNRNCVVALFERLLITPRDAVHELGEPSPQIRLYLIVLLDYMADKALIHMIKRSQVAEVNVHRYVLLLPHPLSLHHVVSYRSVVLNTQKSASVFVVGRVIHSEFEAISEVNLEERSDLLFKEVDQIVLDLHAQLVVLCLEYFSVVVRNS